MAGFATACESGASQQVLALASVVVGAVLGFVGAYLLWWKQRGWQREQVRFERQLEIVRTLDEGLVESERRILKRELSEDENHWEAAHREWEQGWVRGSPFLVNRDLRERYESVGLLLFELPLYEADGERVALLRRAAHQAIQNARLGIAYFGREEDLPAPCFPNTDELIRLLGAGDPKPFSPESPLMIWLKEHPAPPFHPKRDR